MSSRRSTRPASPRTTHRQGHCTSSTISAAGSSYRCPVRHPGKRISIREGFGVDPNLIAKCPPTRVRSRRRFSRSAGQVSDRRAIAETLDLAALLAVRSRWGRKQPELEIALAAGLPRRLGQGDVSRDQWEQLRESELRNGATPDRVPLYEQAITRLQNVPLSVEESPLSAIPTLGRRVSPSQRRSWGT